MALQTNDGGSIRQQLISLLRSALGAETQLVACRVDKQLDDYWVLFARLSSPDVAVIVKLAGPQAPLACPFEQTASLHALVKRHTSVPVAEILAVDVSYRAWPWRYLIARHIPGQTWASLREQWDNAATVEAQRQLGEAAAQLHTIHFPAFGDLHPEKKISWLPALRERARQFIKGARSRELFFSALDQQARLFEDVQQPSLCHEDLHQYNILFQPRQDRWQLAGILDFDKAWAGHAESDLARLEFWHGMTGSEFWQAYRSICPVDQRYTQRRAVYQLFWCLEYAEPSAEHLADTQRVCGMLGLPKIECFD